MSVPALRFPEFEGEWVQKRFSEISELKGRIGYRGYTVNDIVDEHAGAIALSPSNISSKGHLQHKNDTYISWFKYEESPEIMVENGHILLVKTGSTYGKSALVKGLQQKATVNPQVVVIKPTNSDSRFLYSIVIGSGFQKQIHEAVVGGALPTLSQTSVLSFLVSTASLPEQEKIATFLEVVDAKIAALRDLRAGLERYKRGLMQALFSQRLRFTKPDGTAFPDWEEKRLGDLASFIKGKGIAKADIIENGSTECIRYGELYTTYSEVISTVVSKTNVDPCDLVLSKIDDVIIPASGEDRLDIARASCVKIQGAALGGDLNILRGSFSGEFLAYYLCHHKRRDIARFAQGNSVVHLYGTQLKILDVEIPHPDEQQKIADALQALDAKIAGVGGQVDKMEAFKKGLLQQMFV